MHKEKHGELVLIDCEHVLDVSEKAILVEALRQGDDARDKSSSVTVGQLISWAARSPRAERAIVTGRARPMRCARSVA